MKTQQKKTEIGKISREEIKNSAMIPLNKFVILIPKELESDSSIILPDQSRGRTGRNIMLEVLLVDDVCDRVKPGDFVVVKSGVNLDKFEFMDDEFLMVEESAIGCIIRRPV